MKNPKFKIGDIVNWSGDYHGGFEEGQNKIVNIVLEFGTKYYVLDNDKYFTLDDETLSLAFRTPKFYQTALAEIKGNVLDEVYPNLKGKEQLTMTERMGSEEAKCPECSNNEWWLLPADSCAVREGGKPYIECLNCGYQTHL